jgi:hypothetical protein
MDNRRKTNDYENFEKGMINMKILKKGCSREKGEGGLHNNLKHIQKQQTFV